MRVEKGNRTSSVIKARRDMEKKVRMRVEDIEGLLDILKVDYDQNIESSREKIKNCM